MPAGGKSTGGADPKNQPCLVVLEGKFHFPSIVYLFLGLIRAKARIAKLKKYSFGWRHVQSEDYKNQRLY